MDEIMNRESGDEIEHIEMYLHKEGMSVGMLLREIARRFHGIEIPPMPEADPAKTSRPIMPDPKSSEEAKPAVPIQDAQAGDASRGQ